MNNSKQDRSNPRLAIVLGLICVAAICRLVPHPPNMSPIGAIALFGGAVFTKRRWAFLTAIVAMLLSDVALYLLQYTSFIGSALLTAIPVYISYALIVLIGSRLREKRTGLRIVGATISSSALFFVISNFGSWLFFEMYPKTLGGLASAYLAAIPFFQHNFGSPLLNTFVGDAFFSFAMFGGLAFVESKLSITEGQEAAELAEQAS